MSGEKFFIGQTNGAEIKLVVIEDHPLFFRGLLEIVTIDDYLELVGQASDEPAALRLIANHEPDAVLIDSELTDDTGVELAEKVLELGGKSRVIIMAAKNVPGFVDRAFLLGVEGLVLKDDPVELIRECLHRVARDQRFLSPSFGTT